MPELACESYVVLANYILEPIRTHAGAEIMITSGYRSPNANLSTNGVKHSQHIATSISCAADFTVAGLRDLRPLFDWIRMESALPFDQLILEHGSCGDIIHVSWNQAFQRREALEGATHNQSAYTKWDSGPNYA